MRSTYVTAFRAIAVVATAAALCTACGAGPSSRPGVAVENIKPGSGGGQTTEKKPTEPKPPALQKPKTDLAWRDCTRKTLDDLGLGAGPQGLVLECAEFTAPIDAEGKVFGKFTAGAMRARLPQTPPDAAPLVLTSGADRSSTATLAGMAAAPVGGLLADHPIVAVDRRGIGSSAPIDCIPKDARRAMADNAQFTMETKDAVDALAAQSETATIACKDFLQPHELAFDASHAADDLEELRLQWQVDALGIIGAGNGAKVAVAYAAKHPGQVSRLILDSPQGIGLDVATTTEQQVQGEEAAVTAFARRCADLRCSLGPNPAAAMVDLVNRARQGGLGPISANSVVNTISAFVASPRGDQPSRVADLADALSAAGNGDQARLQAMVTQAEAATGSDGQFVARCTDASERPSLQKIRDLQNDWAKKYPLFGREAATAMASCTAWQVAPDSPKPKDLKLPVLTLSSAADPVAGNGGLGSVTGAITAAGGRSAAVTWQGWGHPISAHSACAQQNIVDYLKSGKLPADGTVCPA